MLKGFGVTAVKSWEYGRTYGGMIADVRSAEDFARGHWPGAVNVPFAMIADPDVVADLGRYFNRLFISYTGHG